MGYQKINISSGLSIIGAPFVNIGGEDAGIDIQSIKPSDTQNSGGVSYVRLWNGSSYTDYPYYPADQFGVGEDEVPGWGDVDQNEVSVTINPGQGFWVKSEKPETLSFGN